MTGVTVVAKPDLSGKRFAFALAEDRVGHYPEFRGYFVRVFSNPLYPMASFISEGVCPEAQRPSRNLAQHFVIFQDARVKYPGVGRDK
jgi:hypothetical protein